MRIRTFLPSLLLIAALAAPTAADAMTGREIMEEQERRHEAKSEVTLSSMTVVDKRGNERKRRLVILSSETAENANRSLLKYLEPRDIRNVGLLTWQQPGDAEDDQWLYLQASRQTKRIVGGAKKNAFMGTDLAYEDLRPEDLSVYEYKLAGDETLDGQATWIVEATPATAEEKRNSGYAKRVLWIRQDNYVTVKTSYRDRRDREIKSATYSDLKNVEGDMWRTDRSVIETKRTGSKTITTVESREIGEAIPETVFAPQNISKRTRYR